MNLDRRQHERIECYLIARQMRAFREERDFFGTVRNLSTGGAMIETEECLAEGTILDLAFFLEEEHRVWEGQGEVVWSRKKDDKFFLGLHFLTPLEEQWQESLDKERG